MMKRNFYSIFVDVCRKKFWRVKKIYTILLLMSVFSMLLYMKVKKHGRSSGNKVKVKASQTEYEKMELRLLNYVIRERGTICEMPKLNPFSEEIMKFKRNVTKIYCPGTDWVKCYFSKCAVVKEILDTMRDISCSYRDIIYVNDTEYFLEAESKVLGNGIYILRKSDHVKVSCTAISINGSFLDFLLPSQWTGVAGGLREEPWVNTSPGFNVLVLAFDSAAHNGFRRHMPRSYQVLTEELNATVFHSYNVLGDGTPAALFPILTGKSELEHHEERKEMVTDKIVDYRKFLFHILNKKGYRTAYFEDMPTIGTFQYRFKGFQRQPADHYLRSMFLEGANIGTRWKKFIQEYCFGATPQYRLMLNMTGQFMQLEGKKFGFTMLNDITHDDFNMISAADDDVSSFLRWFRESGLLRDTMLVLMGDHGPRYSDVRRTYQGRIEERLPLLAVVMGANLQEARPRAAFIMNENARVLTTPYDLHATILDIFGLKYLANNYTSPGAKTKRGMSLFDHIPRSRTCGEAGILPFWCACAKWYTMSDSDPMYLEVANKLANFINHMTSKLRFKCLLRHIVEVKRVLHHRINNEVMLSQYPGATMESFKDKSEMRATGEYYQARIVMNPGKAEFEGSMVYYPKETYFAISDTDVSRVNAYGDESICVNETHPELLKFCACS